MPSRRSLLRAALAGAVTLPLAARLVRASMDPIVIYDPVGPGSIMNRALSLIAPPFGLRLGTSARVEVLPGFAEATEAMLAGPIDGTRLMGRTGTGTALAMLDQPAGTPVHRVQPIGKLTAGMSMALAVAADGPYASFAQFADAARSDRLTVAQLVDPSELPLIAMAMVRRDLDVAFEARPVSEWKSAVDAVTGGEAVATFLLTDSLLAPAAQGLRMLCTFGGARHEALPDVPTFRELTQPKNSAFTTALGLFGCGDIPAATVDELASALISTAVVVADEAKAQGLQLDVAGPNVMTAVMERDVRIVRSLEPWMTDG